MCTQKMQLVEPTAALKAAYENYINAWEKSGDHFVPYAASPRGMTYEALLEDWSIAKTDTAFERGFVPATLYFMLDERGQIVGALHLRHVLNESLERVGGHIGYGVRPDARRQGIATDMLKMGLDCAFNRGIKEVLITCDADNAASYRTMLANGCELKDIITVDGKRVRRYLKKLK